MAVRRTSIPVRCEGRNLAAALALFLGVALLGPAPAEAAGCGHQVAHGAFLSAQLDGLRDATPIASSLPAPRAPQPCSGPGCSDAGRPIPSAPTSTVPVSLREWCSLTVPAFVPDSPASAVLTDDPAGRPVLRPARLDRPPRPFA
ncbi:MAG TPA: hypothetical protein VGH33_06260 [Isosphaeraceae bacterium]